MQKGFLPGIAGCVDTQALMETLLDAKHDAREIVVIAWLDLANAYRSVAHNLIQFALEW